MRSMTGFGRSAGFDPAASIGFRVDISSINRKQFEVKFGLPHEISFFENKLRSIVAKYTSRGMIMVRVDFQTPDNAMDSTNACAVNTDYARSVVAAAKTLSEKCGIDGSLSVAELLAIPGVLRQNEVDYSTESIDALLCRITEEAAIALVESRTAEGSELKKDIVKRISILKDTLKKIKPLTDAMPKQQYEKLLGRLKELEMTADPNDDRLLRELVLYADKLDVTEEITRLNSHFLHFDELLESEEPVGRQLDFMIQEIFREINTLGNKAACAEVSPLIVIMKTELEKIREQIQNIE